MTAPTMIGFDLDTIRGTLASAGYAYVRGLPDGFDYPAGLTRLGRLVPQYGGALVRDVEPDPAVSNTVVSSANMAELTPHTEWYEFPGLPPRYVALWCVHPAEGPGGETALADGYRLLDDYTVPERERLIIDIRQWRSRPALAREGVAEVAYHPIIEVHGRTVLLRFSTLDMRADDDLSRRWVGTGGCSSRRTRPRPRSSGVAAGVGQLADAARPQRLHRPAPAPTPRRDRRPVAPDARQRHGRVRFPAGRARDLVLGLSRPRSQRPAGGPRSP